MQFLEFTFSSLPHFIGMCILIAIVAVAIGSIIRAFRDNNENE